MKTLLEKQLALHDTLRKNSKLAALVKMLQSLRNRHNYSDSQMNDLIMKLDLPLNYHMFVTGNFSALMSIKFSEYGE